MNLADAKIPANYVLVKPIVNNTTIKVNEVEFALDTTVNQGAHQNTICEIVKVCNALTPVDGSEDTGVQYDAPIVLQPGDIALCYFRTIHNAIHGVDERDGRWYNGKRIDIDGVVHVFMKYDEIYCAKRGDDVITVNGWNIVRILDKKFTDNGFALPDNLAHQKSESFGIILHPAAPVYKYHEEDDEVVSEGVEPLREGALVMLNEKMVIETEYDLHVKFFDEVCYRVQQKDIYGVVDRQLEEKV